MERRRARRTVPVVAGVAGMVLAAALAGLGAMAAPPPFDWIGLTATVVP